MCMLHLPQYLLAPFAGQLPHSPFPNAVCGCLAAECYKSFVQSSFLLAIRVKYFNTAHLTFYQLSIRTTETIVSIIGVRFFKDLRNLNRAVNLAVQIIDRVINLTNLPLLETSPPLTLDDARYSTFVIDAPAFWASTFICATVLVPFTMRPKILVSTQRANRRLVAINRRLQYLWNAPRRQIVLHHRFLPFSLRAGSPPASSELSCPVGTR